MTASFRRNRGGARHITRSLVSSIRGGSPVVVAAVLLLAAAVLTWAGTRLASRRRTSPLVYDGEGLPHLRTAMSARAASLGMDDTSFARWDTAISCLELQGSPGGGGSECLPASSLTMRRRVPTRGEHARHMREVHAHFAPFRELEVHGSDWFRGPWLETLWLAKFGGVWPRNGESAAAPILPPFAFSSSSPVPPLTGDGLPNPEFWYPLVPIFAQWTDAQHGHARENATLFASLGQVAESFFSSASSTPPSAAADAAPPLRDDIVYVTLVQHALGAPWEKLWQCSHYRNVLLIAGGSWGNIPTHLVYRVPPRVVAAEDEGDGAPSSGVDVVRRPLRRRLIASFVGTMWFQRDPLPRILANESSLPAGSWEITKTKDWVPVAASSLFGLAPRGFGRTSFRLTELFLTGGVVPLYIYDDVPWTAYLHKKDVWGVEGIGFAMPWQDLAPFFCVACRLLSPGQVEEGGVKEKEWEGWMQEARGGGTCACSKERWEELARDGEGGGWYVPPTSHLARMERRAATLGPWLFSGEAAMENVEAFFAHPHRTVVGGQRRSNFTCVVPPHDMRMPGRVSPL